jgi:2,3-bisphosphoglycerate-independent phosphoglycerate mutase
MTAKLVSELSDVMRSVLERHAINAKRAIEGNPLANVVLLR